MGDLGGPRQGGRTRPLGQVKTENLYFHSTPSSAARPSPLIPVPAYPDLRRLPYGSEENLRASIKSMRELRESLRHAALLNIVAAANNDPAFSEATPPPPAGPHHDVRLLLSSTAPSQLNPPHHQQHQQRNTPSPLALQVTSSRGSPFPQTAEGGGRSAGSGAYHSSGREHGGSSSPQTLVANLLSPRIRTISIPRPGPRGHDLPGPYIHRSVTQAKECLTRVGEMVRSQTEGAETAESRAETSFMATPTTHDVALLRVNGLATASVQSVVLPVQGHALDTSRNHAPTEAAEGGMAATAAKTGSALSRDTSTTAPSNSASMASDSSRNTMDTRSAGAGKGSAKAGSEDRSGSGGQQLMAVRRHLTPGKKRELVKRLTEMAKCEAVDITDPLAAADDDINTHILPPMIILSQQRHEIRYPEDSLPVAGGHPANSSPSHNHALAHSLIDGETQHNASRTGSGMYRAKSLSSLIASNNYNYTASTRNGKRSLSQHNAQSVQKGGSLERTQSDSMPDLAMEDTEAVSEDEDKLQQERGRSDSSDWTGPGGDSLFTDGIVGKNIRKDGEGRKAPIESRPLLPSTPTVRARRGTRPSGRHSSLGLRDRGPLDPAANPVLTTTTTSTNVLNLSSNSQTRSKSNGTTQESPQGTASSEHLPTYSQTLPTLTITGLSREKPPPGAATSNSRAARELRPTSRASVPNSMHLFQQLDDQCEKLQRQLNISLNVPRRSSHWQGATTQAVPINRTDVSAHLQCVALGDGRSDREGPSSSSSSTSNSAQQRRSQLLLAPTRTNPITLSDVDEQSIAGTGGGLPTERTHSEAEPHSDRQRHNQDHHEGGLTNGVLDGHPDTSERGILSFEDGSGLPRDAVPFSTDPSSETMDPVLKSLKEARYQGFSSRVSEAEGRSQFHYVNPAGMAESEEAREMKYRVLKALDQDVYYDFQHRKYRNTPATPVSRCNNEEDRPRVHFYKVKVDGEP